MADRFVFEVGIFQEEAIDKFGVEISISIGNDLASTILYGVRVLKIH